jgi:hypothetical protein
MGNNKQLVQDFELNKPSPNNQRSRLFLNGFFAKTLYLSFAGFLGLVLEDGG